ncbi:hypothetical protein AB0D45_27235 [Streptomyces sp. NPDC048352]|uniref:hypothetical protein n=1 Tax=Streptomyces sp. NPDC048352 TaxID=3154718 RepID=UPI003417A1D4
MTLMNLLVDFASTGRIGPLHCGMPLSGAEALLGPGRPHPVIRMKGPDFDGYPHSWDGLDLVVTQRKVSGIWIRLRPGAPVRLPPLVLANAGEYEATVLREDLIAALDAARCRHEANPVLAFGEQSSILTRPADVCAVFALPGSDEPAPHRDRFHLSVLHKHTV